MSLNYNYLYSKHIEKLNSFNPADPGWPNDIGFDEKSKVYIVKYDQVMRQLKDIIQQLQL